MDKQEFIKKIAGYVKKYASDYGIAVHSPIIAQAILESGWGESRLAAVYHNYFGLKCGTKWKGKSVNLKTMEEYTPGTLTPITDNFRVYASMEEGVKGYFEFIQLERYQNLRGIKDPAVYLETIKADGYATSSKYVENTMQIVTQYDLQQYDVKGEESMAKLASAVLAQARAWVGRNEADGTHKGIIDVYNGHTPLARGYKVKYTDAWCATFVSAVAIKCGLTGIIPTECGCGQMIALFKALGEWQESDSRTPTPGDVIFYDWDDNGVGDDTGWPEHVGIVVSVSGNTIKIIEGNKSDSVSYREIAVNGRYIRGYGVPKYSSKATSAGSGSGNGGGLKYSKGDIVNFTGSKHYASANATSGPSCKAGKAKVTDTAEGTKHPYHLIAVNGSGSTVYGWVNASDIAGASTAAASGSIAEGKTVKVKSSATKYATGQTIPSWVKSRKYTVQKIDGDRALLKEITSWVKISDLELA